LIFEIVGIERIRISTRVATKKEKKRKEKITVQAIESEGQ